MKEMVCTCGIGGLEEMQGYRLEAMALLGVVKPADLVPTVLLSLAFDFRADAGIEMDQWFGVWVEPESRPPMWVACDDPADGLLYLWLQLAKSGAFTRGSGSADDVAAAARGSKTLLDAWSAADAVLEEHRATCPKTARDSHWCAICDEKLAPRIKASQEIDSFWGNDALVPAVDALLKPREEGTS